MEPRLAQMVFVIFVTMVGLTGKFLVIKKKGDLLLKQKIISQAKFKKLI